MSIFGVADPSYAAAGVAPVARSVNKENAFRAWSDFGADRTAFSNKKSVSAIQYDRDTRDSVTARR